MVAMVMDSQGEGIGSAIIKALQVRNYFHV
jgi:hypothetical protein